jgi:hypothetical protein
MDDKNENTFTLEKYKFIHLYSDDYHRSPQLKLTFFYKVLKLKIED